MTKLIEINVTKTGKKRIEFFQLGIYELLRTTLGFRYTKINNKGYFLKQKSDGLYEVVNFLKLSEVFRDYIKTDFRAVVQDKGIDYTDFMNAFYSKTPIKNGNFSRGYLGKDFVLSPNNLHLILMEIDYDYREKYKRNEMLDFIKSEHFNETIDVIGNFATNKPLFYKRVGSREFIAFNQPFTDDNSRDAVFDFWLIKVNSEEYFLNKKLNDGELIDLCLGFDLQRDIYLYKEKNTCANSM